ncbi:MAG: glycerophosphodiester phosphodiesterase [Sphingomonadales bacterium]
MDSGAQARRTRLHQWLTAQPFAHRGLHDAGHGIPENSLAAFRLATEKKLGIELDVLLSLDGTAIVFHDEDTERLTGQPGVVAKMTTPRLEALTLLGSDQHVPTLQSALDAIAGAVPLLIEMKSDPKTRNALCASVRRVLEGYRGPVAIMSFDPEIPRWFAAHAPAIARGMVMTTHGKSRYGKLLHLPMAQGLVARYAKAEFIAYDLTSLPNSFVHGARRRGLPVLTWTVRGEAQAAFAHAHADNIIFELVDEAAPQPAA